MWLACISAMLIYVYMLRRRCSRMQDHPAGFLCEVRAGGGLLHGLVCFGAASRGFHLARPPCRVSKFANHFIPAMPRLVKALMAICFVIAWPISKLLDYVLGHEKANLYARGELKELVYLHGQSGRADHAEQLTRDEVGGHTFPRLVSHFFFTSGSI